MGCDAQHLPTPKPIRRLTEQPQAVERQPAESSDAHQYGWRALALSLAMAMR